MNGEENIGSSIPEQGTPPDHESGPVKTLVVIVTLAVLVGAAVWLQQYIGDSSGGREEIAEGQFLTRAGEGEIIRSFPQEFLIDETEEVNISESYQIEYTLDGLLFSVVRYTSRISLFDNTMAFANVLSEDGWSVSVYPSEEFGADGTTGFRAVRVGGEQVEISLISREEGIEVIISHTQPSN